MVVVGLLKGPFQTAYLLVVTLLPPVIPSRLLHLRGELVQISMPLTAPILVRAVIVFII